MDEAIETVIATSDPCEGGDAEAYLLEASLLDGSVVDAVANAARAQEGDAKMRLIWALSFIWREHQDARAEQALASFLDDPEVGLTAAFGLAQGGSEAGADPLRAAAVQNAGASEEAQQVRDEARYWLEELGLDWEGATPPPDWTDTYPLDSNGLAVFDGTVVEVTEKTWGQELARITVATDSAIELVVTIPWDAQILSDPERPMDCSGFIEALRGGQSFVVRITAEDVGGFPWATQIEVLGTK